MTQAEVIGRVVEALVALGIPYMVAGSFASNLHGVREPGPLAGRQVDFATAEDTILTKLEWATLGDSDRQYDDAVGIVQVQGSRLDWPYLERWAATLGLSALLARARRGEPFRA